MKYFWFLITSLLINKGVFAQCSTPTGLFTNNITYYNALANWSPVNGADHYKIHYREYGTGIWSNLGNIITTDSSRNIPLLQPSTTYEWEIISYCDSTNQMPSGWSLTDTFTTVNFIPAPFNPNVINSISHQICDSATSLTLRVTQSMNEPDIETTNITSNSGSFNISNYAAGDSIGYAILNTSTQTIVSTLRVGIVLNPNYAIINSFDSLNNLIGFFNIENQQNGIKVSSTAPNDGNNYTSGYISEVKFTNIFVNPPLTGLLSFYSNISSELNNLHQDTSSVMIYCNTNTSNHINNSNKKLILISDFLGKTIKRKSSGTKLHIYDDGTVEKIMVVD